MDNNNYYYFNLCTYNRTYIMEFFNGIYYKSFEINSSNQLRHIYQPKLIHPYKRKKFIIKWSPTEIYRQIGREGLF